MLNIFIGQLDASENSVSKDATSMLTLHDVANVNINKINHYKSLKKIQYILIRSLENSIQHKKYLHELSDFRFRSIIAHRKEDKIKNLLYEWSKNINVMKQTPLHRAAEYNNFEVVQILIDAGADVHSKDQYGKNALHYASYGHNIETIQILVAAHADMQSTDHDGWTPLHYSVYFNNTHVTRTLVKLGADVNSKTHVHKTPLHYASQHCHTENAKILIDAGADLESKDQDDQTPLHIAVACNNVNVTDMLINMNVDYNSQNNLGKTALDIAVESDYIQIAKMLLDAGAHTAIYDNQHRISQYTALSDEMKNQNNIEYCTIS